MTETQPEPSDPTAPPTARPEKRRRRRLALIVAAVVLVVVAGAAAAFVVTSSDDGGADPVQTVEKYDAVFKQKDCDGFNEVTTRSFRSQLGLTSCAKFDNNAKDPAIASFRLTVRSSKVGDDTASVRTEETFSSEAGQQSVKLVYALVREGGVWLVDGITADKGV